MYVYIPPIPDGRRESDGMDWDRLNKMSLLVSGLCQQGEGLKGSFPGSERTEIENRGIGKVMFRA